MGLLYLCWRHRTKLREKSKERKQLNVVKECEVCDWLKLNAATHQEAVKSVTKTK
jgi:hypothetical protein